MRNLERVLEDDNYDPPRPFTVELAPSIAGNGFTDPSLVQGHVGDWESASIFKVIKIEGDFITVIQNKSIFFKV